MYHTAHIANIHGRTMSKLANKQARTLDLEFTLAPRNRQQADLSVRYQSRPDTQYEFDIPDETFQTPVQPIIDARNEQDFPSLGGAGSGMPGPSMFNIQPSVSIRTKAFGSGGLARTKENFPALGKSNNQSTSPMHNATNNGYKQGMASAMLKTKSNSQQPAKQSSNQSEVVIHVSNRPTKPPEMARGNTKDFPSLPGKSNSKKSNLETDFVSPASAFAMSAIAAKHRNLVDGYESIGAESNSKLALVQKQQQQQANGAAKKLEKVPTLNSAEMFPALGGGGNSLNGGNSTPAWLASVQRQQPVASKKSKVAPPPLSETTKSNQQNITKKTDSNAKNNGKTTITVKTAQAAANNNKKEKTQKPTSNKKKENDISSATAAKAAAAAKNQRKQRSSESFTEDESQFDLSNVIHAVSAKHRGMMYSYESHGADKKIASLVNSISSVEQPKKSSDKPSEKVPKLSSFGLFPSLNKKQRDFVENNNNNNTMATKNVNNFAEMIKKENAPKHKDANDNTSEHTSQTRDDDGDSDADGDGSSVSGLTAANGPPPGFGTSNAPPGFQSVTVNSIVKPLNDLTFTTSLGESFNIIPTYFYMAPPNAVVRNQVNF